MKNAVYYLIALICSAQTPMLYSAESSAVAAAIDADDHLSLKRFTMPNGDHRLIIRCKGENDDYLNISVDNDEVCLVRTIRNLSGQNADIRTARPSSKFFPVPAYNAYVAGLRFVPFIDFINRNQISFSLNKKHRYFDKLIPNLPANLAQEAALYASGFMANTLEQRYGKSVKKAAHKAKHNVEDYWRRNPNKRPQQSLSMPCFTTQLQSSQEKGRVAELTCQVETANIAALIGHLASSEEDNPEAARKEADTAKLLQMFRIKKAEKDKQAAAKSATDAKASSSSASSSAHSAPESAPAKK